MEGLSVFTYAKVWGGKYEKLGCEGGRRTTHNMSYTELSRSAVHEHCLTVQPRPPGSSAKQCNTHSGTALSSTYVQISHYLPAKDPLTVTSCKGYA